MAAKYHINEKGNPGLCKATRGKCPYGELSEHYDSPQQARSAYENRQRGSFLARSRGFSKKMLLIGGMAVMGFSLAGCMTAIDAGTDAQGNAVVLKPAPTEHYESSAEQESSDFSTQDLDQWLQQRADQLEEWSSILETIETPQHAVYESDGIYFQGRSLSVSPQEVAEAQRILDSLVVTAATDDGSYNRDEQFGRAFQSGIAGAVEHRDVPGAVFRNDSPQARVSDGTFVDPYTGAPVHVVGGSSTDADIDHVVPLKEAYMSGANGWSNEQRKSFANDLDNLAYTASSVNRSKGDQDAAQWIPSYEPSQCIYAVKQISIKGHYKLTVDSAEKAALQHLISTKCS